MTTRDIYQGLAELRARIEHERETEDRSLDQMSEQDDERGTVYGRIDAYETVLGWLASMVAAHPQQVDTCATSAGVCRTW